MSHFIFPAADSRDPRIKWDTTHGPGTIQRYAIEVGTSPNSKDIYPGINQPPVWSPGGGPTIYSVDVPRRRGAFIRARFFKNNKLCVTPSSTIP